MISYFGSKSKIAHLYPKPRYDVIVEPFAGSAAYSVLHWRDRRVLLYDVYEDLVAVWKWLQTKDAKTYIESLACKLPRQGAVVPTGPCPAASDFLGWMMHHGEIAPARTIHFPTVNWRLFASRIHRIRDWEIRNEPYWNAPDIEATWFIDPPYQGKALGKSYVHGNVDFNALREWVLSRRGQVIVCDEISATWLPFRPLIHRESTPHKGKIFKPPTVEAVYYAWQ